MNTASPLRYPGGKASMASLLANIRRLNGLGKRSIAEPFAGGAGAALSLLYLEETTDILINDGDTAIFDFWWTLTKRPQPFLDRLSRTRVSMSEWRRQRDTYRSGSRASRLDRAFAAFYLNRCNRSGIIMNGGPIGGVNQDGPWKLNARFNKADLRRRCERVVEYRNRITPSGVDGLDFIRSQDARKTMFFVDPPYYAKGQTLYLNALDAEYHATLAEQLRSMDDDAAWVLTYDDCAEVRKFYRGWANVRAFKLNYAANDRRMGKEVLITPRWLSLPRSQGSAALVW